VTANSLAPNPGASQWDQALYGFLAEKHRRSGSVRTVQGYSRMLQDLFTRFGRTPDQVTVQDVFAFAHGPGLSGKAPSSVTVGARIACLSSFFKFLIRMDLVAANPCDQLERPRTNPSPPRGLAGEQVGKLLSVIPTTPVGLRDRAIVLTLVLTGRRRSEVLTLKRGNLIFQGDTAFYTYRGKGGKQGRRELPSPALAAIRMALVAFGVDLETLDPEASLWPSARGGGITSGTFYTNLQRYFKVAGLSPSGVHIFRHTAAKLRRDAGATVEEVGSFLDHTSLGVTTVYLRRLEGQQDHQWAQVAQAIGL
jgi:site-specific recombinase XerD